MRAGDLRNRVRILRPLETMNAAEVIERTWEEVATVWASVEPSTGDEFWTEALDQRVRGRTVRVRTRARSDVNEQCRVEFQGMVFDVVSIPKLKRSPGELLLLCVENIPEDDN